MKLVYLGSPEAAVPPLRALVAAGHDVLLVVTQPDRKRGRGGALVPSAVKVAARELNIAVSNSPDSILGAVEAGAELGVVVAYGRLIKPYLLDVLPFVNLHFSLLPRWRGAAPVERAVLAGDAETGVCLMALEAGLDTGPVYRRVVTAINPHESAATLRLRLVAIGSEMLVDALAHGPLDPGTAVAQRGEPTYAAKLDPSEFAIDWTRPASAIVRLTRLGAAWTVFRGKRLKVLEALDNPTESVLIEPSETLHGGSEMSLPCADTCGPGEMPNERFRPGMIVESRPMVRVATGEGMLRILRVQPEGKASMDAIAWRNGVQPGVRERLGT